MKHQIFLQKVLFLLHFRSCQKCMRSELVSELHWKLCIKRVLSTREPCTCGYVALLQSFHRGTLSTHWYIDQNFQPIFSMSVLFRRLFTMLIQSSYSFGKIQNVGETELSEEKLSVSLEKDFIFRFHIYILTHRYISVDWKRILVAPLSAAGLHTFGVTPLWENFWLTALFSVCPIHVTM